MDKKQSTWEKIINLPNEYEVNPENARKAIERVQRENAEREARRRRAAKHWKRFAGVAAACAVAVGVFLPVYFGLNGKNNEQEPETVYFEETQIALDDVVNVTDFIAEKALNVRYYEQAIKTQVAVVSESNEIAYIKQNALCSSDSGFDLVYLTAVVLKNAEFAFEEDFKTINQNMSINSMEAQYRTETNSEEAKQNVWAKFAYEEVTYYLQIETSAEAGAQDKIEQYVTMLLG